MYRRPLCFPDLSEAFDPNGAEQARKSEAGWEEASTSFYQGFSIASLMNLSWIACNGL